MYSVVLMAAMTSGGEVADCGFRRRHGCNGGCYGGCSGAVVVTSNGCGGGYHSGTTVVAPTGNVVAQTGNVTTSNGMVVNTTTQSVDRGRIVQRPVATAAVLGSNRPVATAAVVGSRRPVATAAVLRRR